MTVLARLFCGAWLTLLLAGMSGCLPSGPSQLEEENESHFLAGKNCINSTDFKGAIEEFEKALRANPDSGSAHFQLGWLYEEKEPDAAAAIYHYQQFLKLRPKADNAEVIRQHINNCKQDLAKTVLTLPITPGLQRELEKVVEENKRYREELEKWRANASRWQIPTNIFSQPAPTPTTTGATPVTTTNWGRSDYAVSPPSPSGTGSARTCVVRTGDTAFSIARRNGVKLEALLAANPGLDPKRLKIGQILNLPSL